LTVVVGAAIPAAWECTGGASKEKLNLVIQNACAKIK
jgi:hypothetical protein